MKGLRITTSVNISNTHARGYLIGPENPCPFERCTFDDMVRALDSLGQDHGQNMFVMADGEKTSFCLIGSFQAEPFTLYDWKDGHYIHIGGSVDLNITGLKSALFRLIRARLKKLN